MFGDEYRIVRKAIRAAIEEAGEDGATHVAACPGWTVADVVRHLAGLADDWLHGTLEVYASKEWTAAQVESLVHLDVGSALDHWDDSAKQFELLLDDVGGAPQVPDRIETVIGTLPSGGFPGGIVVDAAQHAIDVRSALGLDPRIDEQVTTACVRRMSGNLPYAWKIGDHPAVGISCTDGELELQLGEGEPVAHLRTSMHELMRVMGGRRSADQILSLDWSGDRDVAASVAPSLTMMFFEQPHAAVESVTG